MAVAARANRLLRRARSVVVVTTPPSRPARGRKVRTAVSAIVLGFAVALGVQLVTGWAVRTDRVPLADPQYTDKFAMLRSRPGFAPAEHDRPTTLLFLGSSRTFNAIDARAVGPALARDLGRPVEAFDFAHAGAGPVTTAVYLRRLLADGVTPDAVVIEVHPTFLAAQVSPPPEVKWFSPLRLRPDELPLVRALGLPTDAPAAHGVRGWLTPWHEYRTPLIDRYAPAFSTSRDRVGLGGATDAHGFARVPDVPDNQRARLRDLTRRQYSECWPGYHPGGSGLLGLRDALETCRASGVRAALLITPESTEFRAWYGPGGARIAPLVAELATEFGAAFFDAREWLADDLIADGHHLTGSGADAFTGLLARDSLVPWLRLWCGRPACTSGCRRDARTTTQPETQLASGGKP